jgi:hypothetical protein
VGDKDERHAAVVVRPEQRGDRRSLFRTKDFRLVVRDTFAKYSRKASSERMVKPSRSWTPARIGMVGNRAIPGMGRRQYGRSILNRQCAPCRGDGFCERSVDLHRIHKQAGRLNARMQGIAGRSPLEIDGLKVPLLADGSDLK